MEIGAIGANARVAFSLDKVVAKKPLSLSLWFASKTQCLFSSETPRSALHVSRDRHEGGYRLSGENTPHQLSFASKV
jgi:hypothetical protein